MSTIVSRLAPHLALQLSELSTAEGILPGALVKSLVTSVSAQGLVLQVLGYFTGTIDLSHLNTQSPTTEKRFQIGKTVYARILWDSPGTKQFGLSVLPHVVSLELAARSLRGRRCGNQSRVYVGTKVGCGGNGEEQKSVLNTD